jgi:hypothetical protein
MCSNHNQQISNQTQINHATFDEYYDMVPGQDPNYVYGHQDYDYSKYE